MLRNRKKAWPKIVDDGMGPIPPLEKMAFTESNQMEPILVRPLCPSNFVELENRDDAFEKGKPLHIKAIIGRTPCPFSAAEIVHN